MSYPPIILYTSFDAVLKVKLAFYLHILQIAESFFTFSHLGINLRIAGNAPLRNVPCNDETITILPKLAARSANSTTSSKNYPSSIPITSY